MAQLIRHGSSKGGKTGSAKDLGKRPIKTLIIYASDLVQIIAKVKFVQHILPYVYKFPSYLSDDFFPCRMSL